MILKNIPMQDYRLEAGLSKHELDNFAVAPAYYVHRKAQEWKPSRSMEMGTLIHSLVLEGRTDFAVGPDVDKRTKAGKEEWALFCEENIGKTIVTRDEAAVIYGCYNSCSPLMEHCAFAEEDIETSLFWERDGIACKGRPDMIATINGETCLVDLKTTNDIRNFDSSFNRFRYDVQAAWYQYGYNAATGNLRDTLPGFWFLVVDTEAPHLAQFMRAGSEILEQANAKIEEELAHFKRCQQAQEWPGLPEFKLILPRY
jgi:exodeoxyribonuclease VIII